jgi:hypothetical protein
VITVWRGTLVGVNAKTGEELITLVMLAFCHLLALFVANPFRSRRRVEIENLFLRHQLNIALRSAPHRLRLRTSDRTLLVVR